MYRNRHERCGFFDPDTERRERYGDGVGGKERGYMHYKIGFGSGEKEREMCWDLLRTHIFPRTRELPQFHISPKPLFLSKNRFRNPPKLCTYAKFLENKSRFFGNFFFATGLIFERFLAPRSRFFEKVNGLGVLGFSGIYEFSKDLDSIYIYGFPNQGLMLNDPRDVHDNLDGLELMLNDPRDVHDNLDGLQLAVLSSATAAG
ncbi:hypothetical protein LXL04_038626 [Taraxacum kok-saghyz]